MPSGTMTNSEKTDLVAQPLSRGGRGVTLRRLALALLVILFVLVLAEGLLRTVGGLGRRIVAIPDPEFGWRLVPDQARPHVHDPSITERINNWGFRDRDWPAPDDRGVGSERAVLRVAALGDSFTFGVGVSNEDVWPRRLEEHLSEHLRRTGDPRVVLVQNFALPNFTIEQSVALHDAVVDAFEPDIVLLPIHPLAIVPMRPVASTGPPPLPAWLMRTAIFEWLARDAFDFRPGARTDERVRAWQSTFKLVQQDPFQPACTSLWQGVGARLQDLRRRLDARGAALVLFVTPITQYWLSAKWPSPITYFEHWHQAQVAEAPSTRVIVFDPTDAFIERQGPLTSVIRERGFLMSERNTPSIGQDWPHSGLSLYLHQDFGHFSPRGHDAIAEILAGKLAESGLLEVAD